MILRMEGLPEFRRFSSPLVSICMPTCNGERFIEAALYSILEQHYQPLELVISDDGSTDLTVAICQRVLQYADFPWRIEHHAPQAMVANWNFCVTQTQGEFIKLLFQDDVLAPDCVERMVALASTGQHIGLVFSRRELRIEASASNRKALQRLAAMIADSHRQWPHLQTIQAGTDLLSYPRVLHSYLNKIGEPSCVLIRRDVFERVGFFNPEYQQLVDLEFWLRIMLHYHIGFVDRELATFRLHDEQQTLHNIQRGIAVDEWRALLLWMWSGPVRNHLHPQAVRCLRRKCLNHGLLPQEPQTLLDRMWRRLHWLRFSGIPHIHRAWKECGKRFLSRG